MKGLKRIFNEDETFIEELIIIITAKMSDKRSC